MPTDRSVEEEKKALRQAATKARLKNLRMGKNPITGKTEAKKEPEKKEKSAVEKLREKLTPEILKKAAKK